MTAEREAITVTDEMARAFWRVYAPDMDAFDENVEPVKRGLQAAIANLSRTAEPVAEVCDELGFPILTWIGENGDKFPVGTKLFAHPSEDGRDRRKLEAVIRWLESNQPDVFRRGLWDAIGESNGD